jgi:hypothetical protein
MLTVIFGAGASYDSNPSRQLNVVPTAEAYRPPLANDLFGDRVLFAESIARFERLHPIIPRLRNIGRKTVESVLQELQNEANDDPERLRQLAAVRYYLHTMLWDCEARWRAEAKGISNYKSLLDQIRHRRKGREIICLATFNYDTLLEDALPGLGLTLQAMSDYVAGHPHYRVVKLHGSINWAHPVEGAIEYRNPGAAWQVVEAHIERIKELRIANTFVRVASHPCGVQDGVGLFPAIAIPLEAKGSFECPQEHLKFLCEHLARTDRLLLIGWRATEAHFLDLLGKHLPGRVRALIVAGNEAEAVNIGRRLESKLKESLIELSFERAPGGFSDLIINNRGQAILESG